MTGCGSYVPMRERLDPVFIRALLDAADDCRLSRSSPISRISDPEFGFAIGPVNIDPATRVRWNAAFAYLDPLRDRPTLRIAADTFVRHA